MNFFLLLAFLATPQDRPPQKCSLSGTAVNALTGEPLNKVRILAAGPGSESGATPTTVTDAKGRFTLVDLHPGRYELKGQRNGFLDSVYGARRPEGSGTAITLEAGQQINDLEIKLTPFGVIAGTVRDADGEPLARITVTVHRLRFERGRRHIVQAGGAYTDDLGQYRVPDLPPGKYYIFAEAVKAGEFGAMGRAEAITEDHSPKDAARPFTLLPSLYPGVQDPASARTVEVEPGSRVTGIDIALTRSHTVPVKGRASAPPGMRMSGVEMDYASADSGQIGLHLFAAVNQRDEFEFREVPPGNYVLTASAGAPVKTLGGTVELFPEELKARVPVQVGTSPVENVHLIMAAGAEIAGHIAVADDDKAELSGNMVAFDDGQSDPELAMIAADNTFKSTLPVGRYTVLPNFLAGDLVIRNVTAQGKNLLDGGLIVSGPGKIALEITLAHDGGQLAGAVLDSAEKPVAGATVVLTPAGKAGARADLFQECQSDQYGRFTMEGIAPGDYRLFAWEDIEPGEWWDPEFLKKYESKSVALTIAAKEKAQSKVHLAKD